MTPGRFIRRAAMLCLLAVAFRSAEIAAPGDVCPTDVTRGVTSSAVPADVCIPDRFNELATVYFDEFSWRTFVAMVWPATPAARGVPDAAKSLRDEGPRVFETFKPLWEVFHDNGSAPTADFNAYDVASANVCRVTPQFGDVLLASADGLTEIAQAGAGEFLGPLAAQNGRYVRYQTLYNKPAYDHIVKNRLYLRSGLPEIPSPRPPAPVLQFPNGSVAIKASWLEMAGFRPEQVKRYYTRMAYVKNTTSGQCARVLVGLVGLHVVVKTPSRPQWIWSTFEQVDNVPPARPDAPGLFALHDGTQAGMPGENPLALVPLAKEPVKPFNVVRSAETPINPKTAIANLMYERLLKDTIWKNYQLVMTQWPRVEGNQAIPLSATLNGDATNTFPGLAAAPSAFANTTMETFDQDRVQLGCMNCHNQARMQADFMWSVIDHAYPAKVAPAQTAVRK